MTAHGDWRVLPSPRRADLVFESSGSIPSDSGSMLVHCTRRSAAVGAVTSLLARSPLRRFAMRSEAPPDDLIRVARNHGAESVIARRTRSGRWMVGGAIADRLQTMSTVSRRGELAKVRLADRLLEGSSLRVPAVLGSEPGDAILTTTFEHGSGRVNSLELPLAASRGLASMTLRSESDMVHGDFTPWNLIHASDGPVLVDWESSFINAPPFYDLWHWLVQSHLLLGQTHPLQALERPPVRAIFEEFAKTCGIAGVQPRSSLGAYLDESRRRLPGIPPSMLIRRAELRTQCA